MKIAVDYDLCEANAVCMRKAPEVFRVDDDDNLDINQCRSFMPWITPSLRK